MVEANAELNAAPDATSKAKLFDARRRSAQRVVDAWRQFDRGLQLNGWLASAAAVLAAFELNDAMLSHARWYLERPDTLEPPPLLSVEPGKKPAESPMLRAKIAALCVTLARRYSSMMGRHFGFVVGYEEARRFAEFERGTLAFEQAMNAYVQAMHARSPQADLLGKAHAAALASARLGLHAAENGQERSHAEVLLQGAPVQPASTGALTLPPDVAEALSLWTLRFL